MENTYLGETDRMTNNILNKKQRALRYETQAMENLVKRGPGRPKMTMTETQSPPGYVYKPQKNHGQRLIVYVLAPDWPRTCPGFPPSPGQVTAAYFTGINEMTSGPMPEQVCCKARRSLITTDLPSTVMRLSCCIRLNVRLTVSRASPR